MREREGAEGTSVELLFEMLSQRDERGSTIGISSRDEELTVKSGAVLGSKDNSPYGVRRRGNHAYLT